MDAGQIFRALASNQMTLKRATQLLKENREELNQRSDNLIVNYAAQQYNEIAALKDEIEELKLLAAEACYLLERRTSTGSIKSITSARLRRWWVANELRLKERAKRRVHGED